MITKEHYQFIRQHPAFVNLPVELFDTISSGDSVSQDSKRANDILFAEPA